jgi:hypothetical protein
VADIKRIPKPVRSKFDNIFALVSWRLWLERNGRVFQSVTTLPHQLSDSICEELLVWCSAGLVAHVLDE